MMNNRKYGLLIFILSLAFVTFACGLGGDPTQSPQPVAPTEAPVEPTDVPEEPTDIPEPTEPPAEEPTEAPAAEPTEETSGEGSEEPPVSGAEESAPENAVYIEAINGYRDDLDTLYIVGLVTNNTDRVIDYVEVEIEIFDADNNSIFVEIITTALYTLAPGETSPFSYGIYDELPGAENYVATIVGQGAAEVERATVRVEGVTFVVDDGGDLHITGNLVNKTEKPIHISGLAAATFEDNGALYTADNHTVLVRHLDPGEDGPFRVTMTGPENGTANITEYEIYIDAEITEPAEGFDLVFADSHHNYLDAYDSFHLVGEITNNEAEFLTLSMIAGIYDEDGNVIDAATTDIPTFSIAPGETLPYDFNYWGPINYKLSSVDLASSYTVQWDPYWTWTSSTEYVEISTENDVNEVSDYQITFTGQVYNDSGEDIDVATVIVSLYSVESGELVGMGYGGFYDTIGANERADYTVWIEISNDFDVNAVEYVIVAKGEIP
jgi:hypothetical protein